MRQYNGNKGKIDNCQVGVFGALNAGSLSSIIDAKLSSDMSEKSKIDLAYEIIRHTIDELKIKPQYIRFDSFYGRDGGLLHKLDKKGMQFIADVPESHMIYLKRFQMRVPAKKSSRGRAPKIPKPTQDPVKLKSYAQGLKKSDFVGVKIREGSKGILNALFHKREIYVLDPIKGTRNKMLLLIRKDTDGTITFSFTNAKYETEIRELAYFHCKVSVQGNA